MVTAQRFTETAITFLNTLQPAHSALRILLRVKGNGFEGTQYTAGSVNVIHTPAAKPGAVLALIFQQELQAALHRGMIRRPAETAEAFHYTRGNVRRGWIDHRVVVGERNVAEKLAVVVSVKRSPATITILHAQKPLNGAARCGLHAGLVWILHALERRQNERGVIHMRIMIVAKLESPAARLGVLVLDLPIAAAKNLFGQDPVGRFDQGRVIGLNARFFQGNHRNAGIPDR